jgi:hypothetical protein
MNENQITSYCLKHPQVRVIDSEVARGVYYLVKGDVLGIEAGRSGRIVMDIDHARSFAQELLEIIEHQLDKERI